MTIEEIRSCLLGRGAPAELVKRIADELEAADYARYAPGSASREKMAGALERWEGLLEDLETWEPAETAR